jgi:DNA-binding phage protein
LDSNAALGRLNNGNRAFAALLARIFDDGEVIQLLRAAVEREGNQGAFAKRHGIARSYLNQILNGKRGPPRAVLDALGLRKVYAPK